MSLFLYLYQQSRAGILLAMAASLLTGLCSAVLIALIGRSVEAIPSAPASAALFFGLCLALLVLRSGSDIALQNLTQAAIFRMRLALGRRLLATPLKKLEALGKPALLVILTRDIETFTQAFALVPLALGNAVVIVTCFGYVAWLSWPVFVAFFLFLLIGMAMFHAVERFPLAQLAKARGQMDLIYRHFRGLVHGTKELQLNRRRGQMFVDQVLAADADRYRAMYCRGAVGYIWVTNIGTMQFFVGIGLLLFAVPRSWIPGAGSLTTITLVMVYLIRPISELMMALPFLRQAGISQRKIAQLHTNLAPSEVPLGEADPFATDAPLRLELCGVTHHYPGPADDNQFTLGPIDLTVEQGEIVFIVGGNGSGKTTLALILLGLYDCETGMILLNGVPVNASNRDQYRQHFSAVFSDFELFDELLGDDQTELSERAAHYIDAFGMATKVRVENGKFSTLDLSTGQRRRLALIWSYLEDRPICMFDEWAADQDPAFKRVFYTELLPELKARGKTVLVITHDDAYFSCADRVIKLEDGHLHSSKPSAQTKPLVHFETRRMDARPALGAGHGRSPR